MAIRPRIPPTTATTKTDDRADDPSSDEANGDRGDRGRRRCTEEDVEVELDDRENLQAGGTEVVLADPVRGFVELGDRVVVGSELGDIDGGSIDDDVFPVAGQVNIRCGPSVGEVDERLFEPSLHLLGFPIYLVEVGVVDCSSLPARFFELGGRRFGLSTLNRFLAWAILASRSDLAAAVAAVYRF